MNSLDAVTDYVIRRVTEGGSSIAHIKLQKLMYYVQVWSLVLRKERAFDGEFQAWVHGPVSRKLFSRFHDITLYGEIGAGSANSGASDEIPSDLAALIDEVLEVYGKYSGAQLEQLSHTEKPWIIARGEIGQWDKCENTIKDEDILAYYKPAAA
jgi:uncharacterized phage-associated protein